MKLKTHKASAKRFKLTKSGKMVKRRAGQDHFNSREPGKVTRQKRKIKEVTNLKDKKTLKRLTNQ